MARYEDSRVLTNDVRDITEARRNWAWFVALGVLLIVLGLGVISTSYYSTLFSVFLLGIFLISAGIVQIIQTFVARKWSGLFIALLLGILYLITGFLFTTRPEISAINLTLWIAAFCFVAGLFRMIVALIFRFDHWGWFFFNGLVTFVLGAMIYSDWPVSGLWVIGLFIGVDMLLSGFGWVLLGLRAKSSTY